MYLIYLEAFGGRLKSSEPMEWPNENPIIYLPMDRNMDIGAEANFNLDYTSIKKAKFEFFGRYLPYRGRTAAIYTFTGIE